MPAKGTLNVTQGKLRGKEFVSTNAPLASSAVQRTANLASLMTKRIRLSPGITVCSTSIRPTFECVILEV